MPRICRYQLLAVALLAAACCRAGVKWDTDVLKYTLETGQKTLQGAFGFKNEGPRPVKIVSVQTTCGCTTADYARKTYDVGQTGSIDWSMNVPGGTTIQKHIIVVTDDPDEPRKSLTIDIERPQTFQVDKRIFIWRIGEPPTPQETEIRVLAKQPIKLTRVDSNRDHVETTLEAIEPGRRYRLRLWPKDTGKIVYAMIQVHSEVDDDQLDPIYVFARVLRETN